MHFQTNSYSYKWRSKTSDFNVAFEFGCFLSLLSAKFSIVSMFMKIAYLSPLPPQA